MAEAKIIVMYPPPKDLEAFEHAYSHEHIPMAGPLFAGAGATRAVFTKVVGSAGGPLPVHRIAEIYFPSAETLHACAASQAGKDAIAHAHKISNGGAPTVLIAEEEVVQLT